MLWNVKQVAEYLSISKSMVYKLVSEKKLPCVRLSDCIRFRPETVESIAKDTINNSINISRPAPINNPDMYINPQYLIGGNVLNRANQINGI